SAMARAFVSAEPPGAAGTIIRTGLLGKDTCAAAAPAISSPAMSAAMVRREASMVGSGCGAPILDTHQRPGKLGTGKTHLFQSGHNPEMKAASLDFASIGLLRTFVAVVERGGFSAAARQLQLVPSTVSKHIALLEDGLRVALIHRTTRNLEITDAGRR